MQRWESLKTFIPQVESRHIASDFQGCIADETVWNDTAGMQDRDRLGRSTHKDNTEARGPTLPGKSAQSLHAPNSLRLNIRSSEICTTTRPSGLR